MGSIDVGAAAPGGPTLYSLEIQGKISGGSMYIGDAAAGTDGGLAFVMHYL